VNPRLWRDPVWIGAMGLYALNRWGLRPRISWDFLHSHFNDCLLIPAALPLVLLFQYALKLRKDAGLPRPGEVFFHWLVWSVLFEGVAPRFFSVTGDFWDVVCYAAGGGIAAVLWAWRDSRERNFDILAPFYRRMERWWAGPAMQEARLLHVEKLRGSRRILLAGEGPGKFLEAILEICPEAEITCLDASAGMLREARRAVPSNARVRFVQAKLPEWEASEKYDAVVAHFFLDCFEGAVLRQVIGNLAGAAAPEARWLMADFHMPKRGWQRWRARAWLGVLYPFFRFSTGIQAQQLQDPVPLLQEHGFEKEAETFLDAGFLRATSIVRQIGPGNIHH
jgi:ubiquinone/menaquinone biosynthesis C-methylase UbiE